MVFCDNCRDEVGYTIHPVRKKISIKSDEINYEGSEARCINCRDLVFVEKIHDFNLTQINKNYPEGGSLELNRIYQMDCIEGMRLISDKSIDMILCDLPYGTTACKWDTIIPFEALWEQYKRIIKDNGAIVLTACQPFTSALVMSNPSMFKYELVWDKIATSSGLHAKIMPLKCHESVLLFYKKKSTYNPQMTEGKQWRRGGNKRQAGFTGNTEIIMKNSDDKTNMKYPKSIISISNADKTKHYHPTQKPIPLFEYLIKTYTNEGDTVLDNCIGSGTTAVAALRTNRNFIGFEREPEYVRIANQRLENVKDDLAERKLTNSDGESEKLT